MSDKVKSAYKQSKNIYDAVLTQSKWWSRLYIRFFWAVDDMEIARQLFERLPADFCGALLDVPCGTLNLTIEQYRTMPHSPITCLDYSEEMLAKAADRMAQYHLVNLSAMQGDVGNLPFADGAFDAVLSMNGFHVFPDKPRAYAETARVLKPGGMFLGCFYVKGERWRSDFVVNAVLARKGWFTPPFETKDQAISSLRQHYSQVEVQNDKAMVWFYCIK